MKAITIQISDKDYADLVEFFSRPDDRQMGKPLVAVQGLAGPKGSFLEKDIAEARAAKETRERSVTDQQADYIANTSMNDAYSGARYGSAQWRKAARMLAVKGFTAEEIEAILRSKLTRWAADEAGRSGDDGSAKAADLIRYMEKAGYGFARVARIVAGQE